MIKVETKIDINSDAEKIWKFLNNIWGYTPARFVDTRLVDVHIYRLRLKIEDTPSTPDFILTARGTGYFFQPFKK